VFRFCKENWVGEWNLFRAKLKPTAPVDWVLGAFAKLGKAAINLVMFVRPHVKAQLPLDGFS
jgi:hypothetical protein